MLCACALALSSKTKEHHKQCLQSLHSTAKSAHVKRGNCVRLSCGGSRLCSRFAESDSKLRFLAGSEFVAHLARLVNDESGIIKKYVAAAWILWLIWCMSQVDWVSCGMRSRNWTSDCKARGHLCRRQVPPFLKTLARPLRSFLSLKIQNIALDVALY